MPAAGPSMTTAAENIVATQGRLDRSPRGAGLGTWWWDITNNTLAWDEAMYRLFGVSSCKAEYRPSSKLYFIGPGSAAKVSE